MENSQLLTITDAASRAGVSVSTLRRWLKEGRLVAEPRTTLRDPFMFSIEALVGAGLRLLPIDTGPVTTPTQVVPPDTQTGSNGSATHAGPDFEVLYREQRADNADYRARLSDLQAKLEHSQAEFLEIAQRAARAEGEYSATRRDFESIRDAIAPALAVMSQAALEQKGQMSRVESTPAARRWWSGRTTSMVV